MRRTKLDRMLRTEKVIARRVRQLKTGNSSVPHIHALADRGVMGRCGHKRCICHTSQVCWKHPNYLRDAEVPDQDVA